MRAIAILQTKSDKLGSYLCYSNPIWIVRRIPAESFSQQPFSLYNSFRIGVSNVSQIR